MGILLDRIGESTGRPFLRQAGRQVAYDEIYDGVTNWLDRFESMRIRAGDVVSLVGHFDTASIALLLALLENGNIVVPLDDESHEDLAKRNRVVLASHCLKRDDEGAFTHEILTASDSHPLLDKLRFDNEAGVVLFTSGSTGESKAAVHALSRLIRRFAESPTRKPLNVMVFLKFDHIGGLNTLLSVLMNGGCMTAATDRTPHGICRQIQDERVELLPTTPSFLNMLILSGVVDQYDLSSLKLITYGTEPMPDSTLTSLASMFPRVKLKQTYGLTELGIFPTRSHSDRSTLMAIREGDIRTKVVEGMLYVKSGSAMLGYLNAPSPFDAAGWYNTGDRVHVEGEFTRILGRDSELINVAGEKVYPAEVESVLLEMDNVLDVAVEGKNSPITGQIVAAVFQLAQTEDLPTLRQRVNTHCRGRLEPFKIPRHLVIVDHGLMTGRLKKTRRNLQANEDVSRG